MNKQTRTTLPKFANEEQERAFWETHDSTEYLDWANAQKVTLANLKLAVCAAALMATCGAA